MRSMIKWQKKLVVLWQNDRGFGHGDRVNCGD